MGKKSRDHSRVIGFIDMDSFEVQIYLKHLYWPLKKLYKTHPILLADGERIVSVNSIAKKLGMTRENTVNEAKNMCAVEDGLLIMFKQRRFNKPESRYLRHSSWAVLDAIDESRSKIVKRYDETVPLEFSPSDEFYLDLTDVVDQLYNNNSKANYPRSDFNLESNKAYPGINSATCEQILSGKNLDQEREVTRFMLGLKILQDISKAIFTETGFESSVAVAENKLLAKFACGLNKPKGRTIMTYQGFNRLARHVTLDKLKGLGGDLGETLEELNDDNPMTIEKLRRYKKSELKGNLQIDDEEARFAFETSRGICDAPVEEKLMTNSISVGKANYNTPKLFIDNYEDVRSAFENLCDEMSEKLQEDIDRHSRWAESMQVNIWMTGRNNKGHFTVYIPYLNKTTTIRNDDLVEDTYEEFETWFENVRGRKGKVLEIRMTAKPKNKTVFTRGKTVRVC